MVSELMTAVDQTTYVERTKGIVIQMLTVNLDCYVVMITVKHPFSRPLTPQTIVVTNHAMEEIAAVRQQKNVEQAKGIVTQILTVSLEWLVARITVKDPDLTLQMTAVTAMGAMSAVHQNFLVERMRVTVTVMLTVKLDYSVGKITVKDLVMTPLMIAAMYH